MSAMGGMGAYSFAAAQRAYGVASPTRSAPGGGASGANSTPTIAKIGDAVANPIRRSADSVAVEARASATTDTVSDRLVAATVPGRIDFSQEQPMQNTAGALPFYRHPADKNSAATRIAVSTAIDLNA